MGGSSEIDNLSRTLYLYYTAQDIKEIVWGHLEKEVRLRVIKHLILKELGLITPPTNLPVLTEKQRENMKIIYNKVVNLSENKFSNEESHVQHLQSFLPSCTLPKNTSKHLWENNRKLHLYFQVDHALNKGVTVGSAFIRLWQSHYTVDSKDSSSIEYSQSETAHPWFGSNDLKNGEEAEEKQEEAHPVVREQRFKVNVYSFLRPLKKARKVKRKLINSKIITSGNSGWQTFSVKPAIKSWLGGQRNFGFEVTVQDFTGKFYNPHNFFTQVNCSSVDKISETILPFSNLIQNLSTTSDTLSEEENYLADNRTYPTLDLHTLRVKKDVEELRQKATKERVAYINLNLKNVTEFQLVKREKRSNCLCEKVDFEIDSEEIGLHFLIEPKTIKLSSCVTMDNLKCRARETEDVDITYRNEGWMHSITLRNMNETVCDCDYSSEDT
ncbi:hypothetical protein GQR58_024021 [Nymphon striatum]|nr:hypothetical protein GQR58_024021 [Nymphon striatum]